MEKLADIGNKEVRSRLFNKEKYRLKREKGKQRRKRQAEFKKLGDDAPPKKVPRTLETQRKDEGTYVEAEDAELAAENSLDEFAGFFSGSAPKVLLCKTYEKVTKNTESRCDRLLKDLQDVIPGCVIYKRRKELTANKLARKAFVDGFTDVVVVHVEKGEPFGLLVQHLPVGPTAYFRLTSVRLRKHIKNHANPTDHNPELIVNRFATRVGNRIGRMLVSLFPQTPDFLGRRVITFHNQRDYVFFRQHRYIFENGQKARLQEIGPRFTLKLQYIQHGLHDTQSGEYEWVGKREADKSRSKFLL